MIEDKCKYCKFFIDYEFSTFDGKCHRYPRYEEVTGLHWCGEFKRAENIKDRVNEIK